MTPTIINKHHYPALDGLRGIAILLVVFLHNFRSMNYFFFGWLGVDLFFVLSGFLITNILLNTLDNPHFLRNFYIKRVLRIFPLYYLILVICLFILPAIPGLRVDMRYYINNQLWQWTYLQNWLYIFKKPFGSQMILHTWSLAVEEQFYLVWPVTILLIKRPKVLLAIVVCLLLIVSISRFILWNYHIEDLAYSSLYTFTRIDGICIGCMVAILMRVKPNFLKKYTAIIVLLMAAVNFGFYFINNQRSFTLPYLAFAGYTTFAILFGILIHGAVTGESKLIQFLLNNRPLKFFGKISYGLYVYHWPVYILLFPLFVSVTSKNINLSQRYFETTSAIIVTIIAIFISVLSYHFFEKPFLKLKKRYD